VFSQVLPVLRLAVLAWAGGCSSAPAFVVIKTVDGATQFLQGDRPRAGRSLDADACEGLIECRRDEYCERAVRGPRAEVIRCRPLPVGCSRKQGCPCLWEHGTAMSSCQELSAFPDGSVSLEAEIFESPDGGVAVTSCGALRCRQGEYCYTRGSGVTRPPTRGVYEWPYFDGTCGTLPEPCATMPTCACLSAHRDTVPYFDVCTQAGSRLQIGTLPP
jgi:hypothetical protein